MAEVLGVLEHADRVAGRCGGQALGGQRLPVTDLVVPTRGGGPGLDLGAGAAGGAESGAEALGVGEVGEGVEVGVYTAVLGVAGLAGGTHEVRDRVVGGSRVGHRRIDQQVGGVAGAPARPPTVV
ncbi:hypothetical protein [Streptomyces sp. SM11]|uniref:hypothetical protein n=1 Tax=Streptomyces sp. SM11 TaxID=565557 RepID=UPI0021563550|nr:hypothetical protein [Streptomyces sp. SM11]